jgi:ubiquinone/menaquinone biosynthesis C-methylase UbiE
MSDDKWELVADEIKFNLDVNLLRFNQDVALDAKILDFGCGYGRNSKLLTTLGYQHIYGIDSSQKMIDRAISENSKVKFQCVTNPTLPFSDNCFDAILVCAVFTCIENIAQRQLYIKELRRVLKPEGVLHLVEFSANPSHSFLSNLGVPMWYGTTGQWKELVNEFDIYNDELSSVSTINGSPVQRYAIFARKCKHNSY